MKNIPGKEEEGRSQTDSEITHTMAIGKTKNVFSQQTSVVVSFKSGLNDKSVQP